MKRLLGLVISLIALTSWSQQKVDPANFDEELFNEYVLIELNKQRKRKRLDTLVNDPILEKAAADQAAYMASEQEIGHGQKDREKGDPYKRVLFYEGAHNDVGENVQAYDLARALKKSKNRLTYERLARDLVKKWVKSRPHYANIIGPSYARVGHAFVLRDGVLFACEVFGSKPFEEKYAFQKGPKLYIKQDTECLDCKRVRKKIYNDEVSLGWYTVSNDSIYYWNVTNYRKGRIYQKKKGKYLLNFKRDNLRQVFKAKGNLTIDVLHYEQYDCKGKPSFHNSPYHNGYYINSLNKDNVEAQDMHPSPDLVQVFVGMKPAFVDTFYQVDFHLIKKNRPCIRTSTIYVTPDYFRPEEYFVLPEARITLDQQLVIEDSVEIRIPFQRNQTNEDTSIFYPLVEVMDSLEEEDHHIETIFFTGVASIEGTEKANRKLFLRRGAIVEDYLKRYYPEFTFKSAFYENFDDFRSGLVAAGYVDATEISNDTLRMFANDNREDKEIAEVLDQSRFSTVKVIYRDYFPIEPGSYGLSAARINDLIAEGKQNEVRPLFLVMANKAIDGDSLMREEVNSLSFPKTSEYATLHWEYYLYQIALGEAELSGEKLAELREMGAIVDEALYLEYRLLFNLFNENEAIDVSDANDVLNTIRGKKKIGWIESLVMINEVENYRMAADVAVPRLLENVLKLKFDLRQTYFICQYFIHWGYTSEPYVLLSKFSRRPNEIPKLYVQYLKLGYYLLQFENEREWKKIRMVIANLAEQHPDEFCNLFKWDQMGIRSLEKPKIAKLFCEKCNQETQASVTE